MKTSILIVAALLTAATAPLRATTDFFFKAEVTGTVQTQILLSPTNARIETRVLNNNRIFQEFQVSKVDYELVTSVGDLALILLPKHTGANLPTITVAGFGNNTGTVVDTKARTATIAGAAAPGTATNLFGSLSGGIVGSIRYIGPVSAATFTKFNLTVAADGTDPAASSGAILRFKAVSKGRFNQAP